MNFCDNVSSEAALDEIGPISIRNKKINNIVNMNCVLLKLTFCALFCGTLAQIKTRQPPRAPNSGNLVVTGQQEYNSNYNQQQGQETYYHSQQQFDQSVYDRYNGQFKPAEYYQGEPLGPAPTRAPLVLDATAEFINKTRSGIASGICYTEVATSSLAKNGQIPVSNGTAPGLSKVQICCEGYERNPHVYARCDPMCVDDCPNGICTAPNTCVCIPGHVRNEAGKCVTTCPIGCDNGICTETGECQCKPGYALEPKQQKFCVPQCEFGCQFGKCVAPNKCACETGFRMTVAGTCEPHCENCENGKCTAPGLCSCKQGYTKVGGVCEPVCALGCDHGFCVAPDTCSCPEGRALDRSGTKCLPHCDVPCANGVCVAHNKCDCEPGYVADEKQHGTCVPHCPQGCPNGYCSAPNFCSCNPGFIKSGIKGRLTCNPSV